MCFFRGAASGETSVAAIFRIGTGTRNTGRARGKDAEPRLGSRAQSSVGDIGGDAISRKADASTAGAPLSGKARIPLTFSNPVVRQRYSRRPPFRASPMARRVGQSSHGGKPR